ncbi:MAG: hypothetical protein ACXWRE_03650 [Pseudobdellovibrionaceae bacterium]
MKNHYLRFFLFLLFIFKVQVSLALPAFPDAHGGGAASAGGRGGAVIEVTNLNDSGPGSLRSCVIASGPRTCVFRVAGIIHLLHGLEITNPYLTIAGQTAPGGGILLAGNTMVENILILETHDIIIRYLRIRKGYNASCAGECGANETTWGSSSNVILDHMSLSWNQDEGLSAWNSSSSVVKSFTFSNNIIAEGLRPHSTSMLTGGTAASAGLMTDIDVHHSLMMNNNHRNPFLGNKSTRFVNNLNYNHAAHYMQIMGGAFIDIIGNIFKKGPLYQGNHEVQASDDLALNASVAGVPSIFLAGNMGWSQPNPSGDQSLLANKVIAYNGDDAGPLPSLWTRLTALTNTPYPIIAESVNNLEQSLLPHVGASRRLACDGSWVANRDSVDIRLINQYQTNTGNKALITSESEVGGYPVIASGTPCVDSDHDGMPDVWEIAQGLNSNDPSDGNKLASNGYTNLENYLNSVSAIGSDVGTLYAPKNLRILIN